MPPPTSPRPLQRLPRRSLGSPRRQRASRGAQPLGRRSGGCRPVIAIAPHVIVSAAKQSGLSPAPPRCQRASRGAKPFGRRSGGCPSRVHCFLPLPARKGARGMVSAPFEAKPLQRRVQRGGASLPGVSGGVPLINYQTGWVGGWEEPSHSSSNHPPGCQRASRGAQPLWQEVWRVSLQSSLFSPPSD